MDRFNAYSDALNTILRAENGTEQNKPNLADGHKTTGAQARDAFEDAFARQRAKGDLV